MKRLKTLLLALCLIAIAHLANAAADPVIDTAERYARLQTQGMPGKVSISVGQLDVRTQLPPCTAHEAYTPPGARLWGKTNIGVRCLGPNVWSVLVPVQISVTSQYVTTSRPLIAGQLIQPGDIATLSGDLAMQPAGVVTEPAAAVGKTLKNSLAAGQPLRADQLLAPLVIRQGQTVRLISKGPGFSVSGEGKAIKRSTMQPRAK
jgi:flagellar basal body P-ring formation protein FlgA